jgi:cytochrome d ubiquinol oxidase subunit II
MIAIGSFLAAILLGTAFANLVRGVPINQHMMFTGNLFTLLNPYGLLGGLTTVAIFLLHGANFLSLKLEGELRVRANAAATKLWIVAVVLYIVIGVFTYIAGFWNRGQINPGIIPITAVVVLLIAGYFINQRREGWAFIMVALNIVLTHVTLFSMTYPNVMTSTIDPDFSLTIYNASSSQYTLEVMSVVALIFVPIVLAYQAWTYYMFRKRISTDKETLVY